VHRVTCAASLAIVALIPATAQAAREPLPITSTSPASGAVIPVRPAGLGESSWSLTSIPGLRNVAVIVTLTPATGTDGIRLSDTDLEQFCVLNPSITNEGVYQRNGCGAGMSQGTWTTVPRTYYWQIWSEWTEYRYNGPGTGEVVTKEYASPIFTITVAYPTPPTPPPVEEPTEILTLREVYAVVKQNIGRKTHAGAYQLKDKCEKTSSSTARCKATWIAGRHPSPRTFLYSGVFAIEHGEWSPQLMSNLYVGFAGLRERYGCARRFGSKHCASKVHWAG
jgi:hypothetical protein